MKHSLIKIFFLAALLALKSPGAFAQTAQDCNNNAQNICTNPTFTFNGNPGQGLPSGLNVSNPGTNPQTGNGANPAAPPNTGCLLSNGPGPQWLILTVNTTGNLGFSFGAAGSQFPQAGFYDWAMWLYTPGTCANIFANNQPPVACVWNCTSSGGTGMGPPPAAVPGNTPSACNYAPALPVIAGQQYIILLSNYSGVTTSVSIANNGSAGLSCHPLLIPSATVCPNEAAVVTATWSGISGTSFTLFPGASVQTSPSFTVSAPATQVYTVLAQGIDSANTQVNSRATFALNVIQTPILSIQVPANVCQYATANLAASGQSIQAYSWAGPAGFTSTTQVASIPNMQPTQSGLYTVTAIYGTPSHTCSTNGSAQINVVPINNIVVTPTAISVCKPQNAFFSATSIGATSYSWAGPNSFTSATSNASIYYPDLVATGIYTVTSTVLSGSLICHNTNTVSLVVNPVMSFSLEPFKQLCFNENLNVSGPLGATSYTWSGGGFTSNTTDLMIQSIQPSQSGIYTLSLSLGPCTSSASVQVNVLTPLAFTYTPEDRVICRGDTVTLQAGATGGSENYAYNWVPSTYLTAPTGSYQVGQPLGTTIYNVIAYDIACPSYTIAKPFKIVVNQPPIPNLQLSKTEGCEPLCLFYASGVDTAERAILTYDFGGIMQMQNDNFSYCLKDPGTYTLNIQSKGRNGCIGTYTYRDVLVVHAKPHSDITWSPLVPNTTDNQVTFSPSSKYGPIISYDWMFGGTMATGADTTDVRNPQRIYETAGKYPVMLISKNEMCADTVIKILDIRDDFNVFIPNTFTPNGDGNNDLFMIKGQGMRPEGYTMEIYDRWGNLVYSTREILKGWDGSVKGQLAADGIYIYKIRVTGANGEGRKEYMGHVTLLK